VGKAKNYLSIIAAAILLGLAISSCATQSNHLLALEITSPQSKSEVTTDVITISGIVSSSQAAVTINGRQVTVGEDGGFSTTVELDYGENTVVVSATAEGEEPVDKTVTITRVLDLEITSPEDNAEVTESPILVPGYRQS
jgi:lipopolysaccharide export system protein LptA